MNYPYVDEYHQIARRMANAHRRMEHPEESLTNWQRKQWAREGYPRGAVAIGRFSRLQKDGTELYSSDILPYTCG